MNPTNAKLLDDNMSALERWEKSESTANFGRRNINQIDSNLQTINTLLTSNILSFSQRQFLVAWFARIQNESVEWTDSLKQLKKRISFSYFPVASWDMNEFKSTKSQANVALPEQNVSGTETDEEDFSERINFSKHKAEKVTNLAPLTENYSENKFTISTLSENAKACTIVQRTRIKLKYYYKMSLQENLPFHANKGNKNNNCENEFESDDLEDNFQPAPLTKLPSFMVRKNLSQRENLLDNSQFLLSTKRSRSGKKSSNVVYFWQNEGIWKVKNSIGSLRTVPNTKSPGTNIHIASIFSEPDFEEEENLVEAKGSYSSRDEIVAVIFAESDADTKIVKISAIVPNPNFQISEKEKSEENMIEKLNFALESEASPEGFVFVKSRKPKWSSLQRNYTLSFDRGEKRVREPSRKNLSFKSLPTLSEKMKYNEANLSSVSPLWKGDDFNEEFKNNNSVLQVGKMSEDTFSLDFGFPLSPFQAFSIFMTAFDC